MKHTFIKSFALTILVSLLLCAPSFAQMTKQDSPIQFTHCSDSIKYSVDDFLLKQQVGPNLLKPDVNPVFSGGLDSLKRYFLLHPLTDEKTKNIVFRVHISLVINCLGKAGEFQIISKGKGELEDFALEVLDIVKNLPQHWAPAIKDGKLVDCYQVLSFTVISGALDKVSYR